MLLVLLMAMSVAWPGTGPSRPAAADAPVRELVLATTTSVQLTGLLDVLLPACRQATGLAVKAVAVGTGKAFEMARAGDADLVLGHAPALEARFIADGFGVHARALMYNDFLILGPADDPAGAASQSTAAAVLQAVASAGQPFVSRGDLSGTHLRERELWATIGGPPTGATYLEAGQGMGETLQMAFEKRAYVLCDRATWLFMRRRLPLRVIYENPIELRNTYSVLAVSNTNVPAARTDEAIRCIDWLTGPQARQLIASFTIDGERLFQLP
ncbi:MAG: ABC-type tungstate transport system, periplasmic binding protein [Candidatus Ozemobacter sibiricus]|uniref:ABC-type tungstate transport system, periplasmic binding protein n=1 Tax=Candidatus Ozemobacter sibiricus TaxID=2268124 RepID=A0A367Z4Z5_9BACT|nr:MAG: ABC-type tungstate transport system, periplasmic binding protein [Candidatus Ozemobacter sibiricus]